MSTPRAFKDFSLDELEESKRNIIDRLARLDLEASITSGNRLVLGSLREIESSNLEWISEEIKKKKCH